MTLLPGASRRWVYVRHIAGTYQRLHRISGTLLIGSLLVVPWIRIGGNPLLRADLPGRRLHLFGSVFTATDGFDLVLLALLAAFSLFLATAVLGRLWCGYACPQSVFLEEWIRPIEHLIEGDAGARRRRDAQGWTADRLRRKVAKWSAYALLAVVLAGTVVSYFSGAWPLWTGAAGPVDYTLVGIVAGGLFLDWAWFREQLCNYLCPYARFQGALTDDHSLVITYDLPRGEPRGKGRESAAAGRCIDCLKCVDVCPAGIDIRDGFQLECIACARCVDACESVLPKLGFPTLVRYSTAAKDAGAPTRIVRRRTVVYVGILATLLALLGTRIAANEPLEVSVSRSPGSLYAIDDDGHVRNTFLVRVANTDPQESHLYVVSVHGLDQPELSAGPLELQPLDRGTVAMSVRMDPVRVDRTTPFTVRVEQVGGEHHVDVAASFTAPPREGR